MKSNTLNFGIIGNCQSSALINENSSIDWCCLPQFDSASVFAKILDEQKGGSFKIECDETYNTSQNYIENTSILVTKFENEENSFEVIDFMPRYQKENGSFYSPPEIIRFIKLLKGKPKFKTLYDPKLEYALGNTNTYGISPHEASDGGAWIHSQNGSSGNFNNGFGGDYNNVSWTSRYSYWFLK